MLEKQIFEVIKGVFEIQKKHQAAIESLSRQLHAYGEILRQHMAGASGEDAEIEPQSAKDYSAPSAKLSS